MKLFPILLIFSLLLASCTRSELESGPPAPSEPESSLAFREIASPAAPGSGMPFLSAGGDDLLLSWTEPQDDSVFTLRFARLDGNSWSAPHTIASGSGWFVNWADFPTLVQEPNGALAAHYLAKSGEGTYAYDVRITRSDDGGATWSPAVTPHRDGTQTEHGFVSLIPEADGMFTAVWLDGRNTGGHDGHGGAMTLRTATLDPEGRINQEAELDARVCDCCQTAAARTAHGLVVAYRDRTDGDPEVRDISIVRYADGAWTEPQPLHHDNWELNGCPVNGPALAANGEHVAVAWFTAAQDQPRVRLAFSQDSGATFGEPIAVDDGNPIGRVDVALLPGGEAIVSWVERTDDGADIRMRRVAATGRRSIARTVAPTSPQRASGFPQLALHRGTVYVAWTEASEPSRLHTAVAALGS